MLVIDTPGLPKLPLGAAAGAVDDTFVDLNNLAAERRFRDCAHGIEPGCAVRAAIADGTLEETRFQSGEKLAREQAFLARQINLRLARPTKDAWIRIHREVRGPTKAGLRTRDVSRRGTSDRMLSADQFRVARRRMKRLIGPMGVLSRKRRVVWPADGVFACTVTSTSVARELQAERSGETSPA